MSTVLGVIGDIHARWDLLEVVLDALAKGPDLDGVLLVGDFACAGRGPDQQAGRRVEYLLSVDRALKMVGGLGVDVLYVPGNHDHPDLTFSGNVDRRAVQLGDLMINGIGGAGPDRMGFCYEWDEDEIRSRERPSVDVLLSHCPPMGTQFDRLPSGQHVGSMAVLERVQGHHGVAAFGHIHEAHGVGVIGSCLCINPGGLGPPMAHPRAGWIFGTEAVMLKDLRSGVESSAERGAGR